MVRFVLDVQKLFSIAFEEDKKSRRALEYAVDVLSVEKDIAFHRAFSDAYYTAKVLQKIPEDIEEYCSYDVFHLPTCKEKRFRRFFQVMRNIFPGNLKISLQRLLTVK